MNSGQAHRPGRTFSKAATAAVAIIIVAAVAAGVYIGVAPHSGARSQNGASPAPAQATTSSSSLCTVYVPEGYGDSNCPGASTITRTLVGPGPPLNITFGAQVHPTNSTLEVITANTIAWTSWVVNGTTQINYAQTQVIVSSQYGGSNITAAIFVNGMLAGNETYQVDSILGATTQTMSLLAPMIDNSTVPAGTVVSLAIFSTTPMSAYFTSSIGVETNEASINGNAGTVARLPAPSSSVPNTMEIYAYN